MVHRYGTLSFLSDFGHGDEFVGVVHSVVASIAPDVRIIDVSHGVHRHDVRSGGLVLARAAQYLCPGVVVAVVDPGVGSARRAVAIEVGDGDSVLVGPDNGLLAPAVALVGGATRAVELTNREFHLAGAGSTFDGRDVFAPVGAHLCVGVDLDDLGPRIEPAALTPSLVPVPEIENVRVTAAVLWIDSFGNAELNLGPDDLIGSGPWSVTIADDTRVVSLADSYDAIPAGEIGLVVDSQGLVALSVRRGDAASELGIHEGSDVVLAATDAPSPVSVQVAEPTRSPRGG